MNISSDNMTTSTPETNIDNKSEEHEIEYFDDIDLDKLRHSILLGISTSYLYLILGTAFNIISMLVFSRKSLKASLSAKLFRFLALMDLIYILDNTLPAVVEHLMGKSVPNVIQCQALFLISNIAKNMSSCTLALVTVERFIAVIFPHTAKIICKPKRMYAALFVAFWINLAISIAGCWHMSAFILASKDRLYEFSVCVNESRTIPKLEHFQDKIWPWLDYLMYLILPVFLMFPMDIGIAITLFKANRRRHSMSANTPGGAPSSTNVTSMTGMLLSVCFAFFVFATPDAIAYFRPGLFDDEGDGEIWQVAAKVCLLNNHSFNLIFYCLTGRKFRQETWTMLTSKCKKQSSSSNDTVMTSVSKLDSRTD